MEGVERYGYSKRRNVTAIYSKRSER